MDTISVSPTESLEMVEILKKWTAINTHSTNLSGLQTMLLHLEAAFAPLDGKSRRIKLPTYLTINAKGEPTHLTPGMGLSIKKRPDAPVQILLTGHYDTVFDIHSPFQSAIQINEERLQGPGAADMKGGILIMLKSLQILEHHPAAKSIGWHVLLNPDEEIGSPSSAEVILKAAKEASYGFVFEPAFPSGELVSSRKGSYNFVVVAHGKAAHAGRDFAAGQNAIAALANFIVEAHALNQKHPDASINIGKISGGEAANIVPALAMCHINIRSEKENELHAIGEKFQTFAEREKSAVLKVYSLTCRNPKPIDIETEKLFGLVKSCAKELDMNLNWKPTGGVCDGNLLTQAGLPNIDTLGAVGGNLHTEQEYIEVKSLAERAKLTALTLVKIGLQNN